MKFVYLVKSSFISISLFIFFILPSSISADEFQNILGMADNEQFMNALSAEDGSENQESGLLRLIRAAGEGTGKDATTLNQIMNRLTALPAALAPQVKDLVNKGSGKYGSTPLMWAARMGMEDSVAKLCQVGASPLKKNKAGSTVLLWTAKMTKDKGGRIFDILMAQAKKEIPGTTEEEKKKGLMELLNQANQWKNTAFVAALEKKGHLVKDGKENKDKEEEYKDLLLLLDKLKAAFQGNDELIKKQIEERYGDNGIDSDFIMELFKCESGRKPIGELLTDVEKIIDILSPDADKDKSPIATPPLVIDLDKQASSYDSKGNPLKQTPSEKTLNLLPRGSAVFTQGYGVGLPVIHAASGSMNHVGPEVDPTFTSIEDSIFNSVRLAKENGINALLLPLIGGKIFLDRIPEEEWLRKMVPDLVTKDQWEKARTASIVPKPPSSKIPTPLEALKKNYLAKIISEAAEKANKELMPADSVKLCLNNFPGRFLGASKKYNIGFVKVGPDMNKLESCDFNKPGVKGAVVNAANTEVAVGGGISGALGVAAGKDGGKYKFDREAEKIKSQFFLKLGTTGFAPLSMGPVGPSGPKTDPSVVVIPGPGNVKDEGKDEKEIENEDEAELEGEGEGEKDAPKGDKSLAEKIQDIDHHCNHLKGFNIKGFLDSPSLSLEKEEMEAAEIKLAALEKKFGENREFMAPGWHGMVSFQRMAWQDKDFLEAVSDPTTLKALLLRNKQNKEKGFGKSNFDPGHNTLFSLFYSGLKSGRMSYLATVAPNYLKAPEVEGVSWGKLKDMGTAKGPDYIKSLEVTPESLDNFQKACSNLEKVFNFPKEGEAPKDEKSRKNKEVENDINKATNSQLLSTLSTIFDTLSDEQMGKIVGGSAGGSTELDRMRGQSFEVMDEYDKLLKYYKGDHSKVLGLGIVSHALDAKHLAANIHGIIKGNLKSPHYFGEELKTGFQNSKKLLEEAAAGTLGEPAGSLLRARLQQVLSLVNANRGELGLTPEKLSESLKRETAEVWPVKK